MTLKLSKISIFDLLGEFNHRIKIQEDQNIAILYGPNGVGKTHVLRFIHHALRGEWLQIQEMPFSRAELQFDNGTTLFFSFKWPDQAKSIESPRRRILLTKEEPPLFVELDSPLGEEEWYGPQRSLSDASPMMIRRILERELYYRRTDDDIYIHRSKGGKFTFEEAVTAEARSLNRILTTRYSDSPVDGSLALPELMHSMFNSSASTFIETQRLVIPVRVASSPGERTTQSSLAIDQVSESVQSLMEQALADNSRLSQRLDSTFPSRLFDSESPTEYSETEIRQIHQEQQDFRARLAEYHLGGDDESNVELPQRPLEPWEIAVLGRYLRDSTQKLSSFRDLLERLDVFIHTLNSRFFKKSIKFSSNRSLEINSWSGNKLEVSDLSSGEQHEMILLKYLLFDSNPDSMVLIDEPEISLHVTWQKAFLADLNRISLVSNLRFIIATHSPQIINNSWNLTVRLGDDDE